MINKPNDALVSRKDAVLFSEVGDNIVMMNADTGDYIDLEGVAADIWRLLETPMPIDALVERLVKLYDVDKDQCLAETTVFLADLHDDNLIVLQG